MNIIESVTAAVKEALTSNTAHAETIAALTKERDELKANLESSTKLASESASKLVQSEQAVEKLKADLDSADTATFAAQKELADTKAKLAEAEAKAVKVIAGAGVTEAVAASAAAQKKPETLTGIDRVIAAMKAGRK